MKTLTLNEVRKILVSARNEDPKCIIQVLFFKKDEINALFETDISRCIRAKTKLTTFAENMLINQVVVINIIEPYHLNIIKVLTSKCKIIKDKDNE